jgi:hypothetical protein
MEKRGRPRKRKIDPRAKAVLRGNYKGYDFLIFDNWMETMRHYCAYIRIPEGHKAYNIVNQKKWYSLSGLLDKTENLAKKTGTKIPPFPLSKKSKSLKRRRYHLNYDELNDFVHVHGGFTFADKIKKSELKQWVQKFTPGLWVGWDYAHAWDAMYIEKEEDVLPEYKESWKRMMEIHNQYPQRDDKRWTLEEVEKEVKSAIQDLRVMVDWRLQILRMARIILKICYLYTLKFWYSLFPKKQTA